jgi:hypothetical protein
MGTIQGLTKAEAKSIVLEIAGKYKPYLAIESHKSIDAIAATISARLDGFRTIHMSRSDLERFFGEALREPSNMERFDGEQYGVAWELHKKWMREGSI